MSFGSHSFYFNRTTLAVASSLAVLLSACGGGGGGGSTSSSGTLSSTPVALTSSNYQTAASETISSTNYVTSSASLVSGVEVVTADSGKLLSFAKSKLKSVGLSSGGALPTGATYADTILCNTGHIAVSITMAGSNLAAGDAATFTAYNCFDAPTNTTYNGGFSFAVTSVSGDYLNTYLYNIGLNLTFSNFQAVTGSTTILGNGTFAVTENSTSMYSSDSTFNTSSFNATATYGSTSYSRLLTNFQVTQTLRPNTPTSTYKVTTSASGTVSSSALDSKAVTISTLVPFVLLSSDLYPYTGQALATGSGGSKVRVTAQNATNVLVELDANGDGTYETSTVKTWASL